MRQVTMDKASLLAIVKKNRDDHREIFLAAQKKYRQKAIEVLDAQLKLAVQRKRTEVCHRRWTSVLRVYARRI